MNPITSTLLRKKQSIYIDYSGSRLKDPVYNNYILTCLNCELFKFGYRISEYNFPAFDKDLNEVVSNVINVVCSFTETPDWKPMYVGFPMYVKRALLDDLYFMAVLHYVSGGVLVPTHEEVLRENKVDHLKLKELKIVGKNEVCDMYDEIVSSNESLSPSDKEFLTYYTETSFGPCNIENIVYKETLGLVSALAVKQGECAKMILDHLKTETDLLRFATAYSCGDVSLSEPSKFTSFPTSLRKKFLNRLEEIVSRKEFTEIKKHKAKWKHLFYMLHIGSYAKRFPKSANIANSIRSNTTLSSTNTAVEKLLTEGKYVELVDNVLVNNQGEFARRIINILSKANKTDCNYVVSNFDPNEVDTRVLLQLLGALGNEGDRVIFPKSTTQKCYNIGPSKELDDTHVLQLKSMIYSSLVSRFEKNPVFEKNKSIYVDPILQRTMLPTQMRSASEGYLEIARGSRIPLEHKGTVRLFTFWIGSDIDLSAHFVSEDFERSEAITYYNLKSDVGHHSGDITYAPKGASEFVDFVPEKVIEMGYRYVTFDVRVYNGPSFNEHKECFVGFMERNHPNSNEIYEENTVVNKIKLTSDSRNCIPCIFDCKSNEFIWADVNPRTTNNFVNNVASNEENLLATLKNITGLVNNRTTLMSLINMHIMAAGCVVTSNKDNADVIIGPNGDINTNDVTLINSKFMV